MDPSKRTETHTGDASAESAFGHLPSHLRFWILGAATLWLDLWSKHAVFSRLSPSHAEPIIDHVIEFRRSLNDGAVFGSFTGYVGVFIIASLFALGFVLYLFARSTRAQWGQHIALALILAGALGNLYDRAFIKADVARLQTASGQERSIIGTIVSDPSDALVRIGDWPDGTNVRTFARSEVTVRRQGVVRDFIKFVPEFPTWVPKLAGREVWPWVFNVADATLVVGVALLLIGCSFGRRR